MAGPEQLRKTADTRRHEGRSIRSERTHYPPHPRSLPSAPGLRTESTAGGHGVGDHPIPSRTRKLSPTRADGTAGATRWESTAPPAYVFSPPMLSDERRGASVFVPASRTRGRRAPLLKGAPPRTRAIQGERTAPGGGGLGRGPAAAHVAHVLAPAHERERREAASFTSRHTIARRRARLGASFMEWVFSEFGVSV